MSAREPNFKQRAQIALGIAVIAVVFLGETFMAHRVAPNPASPVVWTALGTTGIGALLYALWCGLRLRRTRASDQGAASSK